MNTLNGKLLLESIRLVDGQCPLLAYHQERVDRSRKLLYPKSPQLKLKSKIADFDLPDEGTYKLRLVYGHALESWEIQSYTKKTIRTIRLLDNDNIQYAKKYEDRQELNACFAQRGSHDDVLIVQHGFLTDTTYANIALFDGHKWFTPSAPLLRGTRRAKLLKEGKIKAAVIREKDLPLFKKARLINAMLPWGIGPEIDIEAITR